MQPSGWPDYLEQVLSTRLPQTHFSVQNQGSKGNQSTAIVDKLPSLIENGKPDIIVVMMGINDASAPHLLVTYAQTFPSKTNGLLNMSHPLPHAVLAAEPVPIQEQVQLGQANDHLQTGDYKEAMRLYQNILVTNPNSEEAYMGLALVYRRQSQYDSSLKMYDKVLAINPNNGWAYEGVGSTFRGLGQFDKAEKPYKKAIELLPDQFMPRLVLAQIYREQGRFPEAKATYEEAISRDPENDFPKIWLSRLYRETKEFTEAETLLKQIIKKRERYEEENRITDTLVNQEKYDEAETIYKRRIKETPENYITYIRLGYLYGLQGKETLAREMLNQAITRNYTADYPAFPYHELSLIYRRTGNINEAKIMEQEEWKRAPAAGNFRKLAVETKKHGIHLIVVQYPFRGATFLKELFAHDSNVILIDTDTLFKQSNETDTYHQYFTDYEYGDFGHYTEKSSRILADDIAQGIIAKIIRKP